MRSCSKKPGLHGWIRSLGNSPMMQIASMRIIAWAVGLRALLALAPVLSLALWTGQPIYLATTLIGATGLITVERVNRSGVLLALHALATAALFLLFLIALPYPPIFVLLCAACGFASVAIGRFGEHLIS